MYIDGILFSLQYDDLCLFPHFSRPRHTFLMTCHLRLSHKPQLAADKVETRHSAAVEQWSSGAVSPLELETKAIRRPHHGHVSPHLRQVHHPRLQPPVRAGRPRHRGARHLHPARGQALPRLPGQRLPQHPDTFHHSGCGVMLETKVIRMFPKISQSRRRPLLGPSPG